MPFVPISAFYTALLAILMLILAYQVVKQRMRHKSGLGHTEKDILIAGRNHANASEYIPITLLLMVMAELNGANGTVMHIGGCAFLFGRLAHAWGYQASGGKSHSGRYWGTLISWLVILWLCAVNLALSWRYIF